MNTVSHPEIIGLDVSRDWLDIHCLSDDRRLRLPNTDEGHSKLEEIAASQSRDQRKWTAPEAKLTFVCLIEID